MIRAIDQYQVDLFPFLPTRDKMAYQKSCQDLRSELRKTNKPLMEKRRRARINVCLTQLKSLVLDAMRKDTSRYSKLEKADVLEMTVKHLKSLQKQHINATTSDPTIAVKYSAGYSECANQVFQYLNQNDDIDPQIRTRLVRHLTTRVQNIPTGTTNYHQRETSVIQRGSYACSPNYEKTAVENQPPASTAFHEKNAFGSRNFVSMTTSTKSDVAMATGLVAMTTRDVQPLDLSIEYRNSSSSSCQPKNIVKTENVIWRPW